VKQILTLLALVSLLGPAMAQQPIESITFEFPVAGLTTCDPHTQRNKQHFTDLWQITCDRSTSVWAVVGDRHDLRAYGAIPDDATTDAAAIQRAFVGAAGGGTIVAAGGEYELDATVQATLATAEDLPGVRLECSGTLGSTFTWTGAADGIMFQPTVALGTKSYNLTVEGCKFQTDAATHGVTAWDLSSVGNARFVRNTFEEVEIGLYLLSSITQAVTGAYLSENTFLGDGNDCAADGGDNDECDTGIYLGRFNDGADIVDTLADGLDIGIHNYRANRTRIMGGTVQNNDDGILVDNDGVALTAVDVSIVRVHQSLNTNGVHIVDSRRTAVIGPDMDVLVDCDETVCVPIINPGGVTGLADRVPYTDGFGDTLTDSSLGFDDAADTLLAEKILLDNGGSVPQIQTGGGNWSSSTISSNPGGISTLTNFVAGTTDGQSVGFNLGVSDTDDPADPLFNFPRAKFFLTDNTSSSGVFGLWGTGAINIPAFEVGIGLNRFLRIEPGGEVTLDDYPDCGVISSDGSGQLLCGSPLLNGAVNETVDLDVTVDTGDVLATIEADLGGDLTFYFGGVTYTLDCTPVTTNCQITLTEGTDTSPTLNYLYVTEAAGVLTFTSSTSDWPATSHAPIATALIQTDASVTANGAYKVHAWTDHVSTSTENGHLSHLNRKFRTQHATWDSGTAANTLTISNPDAWIDTDAGEVYQLHLHDMPALDMAVAPFFVVNEPGTPFMEADSLADITQDASSVTWGNNKYGNLVVVGVVSEDAGDSQGLINLPTSTYTLESDALIDAEATSVYTIPADFVGTGFLIARYTVRKTVSGWTQSGIDDLRGDTPSTAPGSGGGGGWIVSDGPNSQTISPGEILDFVGQTDVMDTLVSVPGNTRVLISLKDTAVTPAEYATPILTVDQQGRLTAIEDGGSQFSLRWEFTSDDSSTCTGVTGVPGRFDYNSATVSSVTLICYNHDMENGADVGGVLETFGDTDTIVLQQIDDPTKWAVFKITADPIPAFGDAWQFTVTHEDSSGTFDNGEVVGSAFFSGNSVGRGGGSPAHPGSDGDIQWSTGVGGATDSEAAFNYDDTANTLLVGTVTAEAITNEGPLLTVGDGVDEDLKINFDRQASGGDPFVAWNETNDNLEIDVGSAVQDNFVYNLDILLPHHGAVQVYSGGARGGTIRPMVRMIAEGATEALANPPWLEFDNTNGTGNEVWNMRPENSDQFVLYEGTAGDAVAFDTGEDAALFEMAMASKAAQALSEPDTTPSIKGGNVFTVPASSSDFITDLDDYATSGSQPVWLIFLGGSATVDCNGPTIYCNGGGTYSPAANDSMQCVEASDIWYCHY